MNRHWLVDIFVRRGAFRRFTAFKAKTKELPVRVHWDRRVEPGDPPGGQAERRHAPPFTWDTADFVVAERGSEPE